MMVGCVTLIAIFAGEPSETAKEAKEAESLAEYSLLEPHVFEPTQGQKHFYTVYVPEDMIGSDRDLYAIAAREYPGRGEQVGARFFTDIGEAESAACYDKPNKAGFSLPCNGKEDGDYPSHWGYIHLTPTSRIMIKTFLNRSALDAALSHWELEEPVSKPLVLGTVSGNVPSKVDFTVRVPTETEATMQRLCSDAHTLYQEESQLVGTRHDTVNVHFLIGDRAENDRWLGSPFLGRKPITKISFRPNRFSRNQIDQANWTFRMNGAWDEGSPIPTCQGTTVS